MEKTKKRLEEYWDEIISKKIPSYVTFKKMNEEVIEHLDFIRWVFKRIILPMVMFYVAAGLILRMDILGSIFLSTLLFFYSNLLPDVDALFQKTEDKMLDSLWYEKYSLLFFAPMMIYYIISGRARPLYSTEEKTFHNYKTVVIYGAFLFIIGSIFWMDTVKRVMFPLFGMLGFTTHLLIDRKLYVNRIYSHRVGEEVTKKVYVCGSFRFINEMDELEKKLRDENIECEVSKKTDNQGILGCLDKIDDADVVYVVNPEGYVGRSICFDLGYAYAKSKPIYTMYPIGDPPVMSLIKGVLTFEELISLLKHNP